MHLPLPAKDESFLRVLQYIVFISVILYFGSDIFIPLSFAALISFTLYPICIWLERRKVPRMAAIVISVFLLLLFGGGMVLLLVQQFISFLKEWPAIHLKLSESIDHLSQLIIDYYSISKEQQQQWLAQVANQSSGDVLRYLFQAVSASTFSAVLLILIPVFAVLILYYRHVLVAVTYRLFPGERHEDIKSLLFLTIAAYYNFIKGMIVVYAVVGVLNSIGLLILGVPHAVFFGFMAAILTFIPYIGIMVGSLLPIAMSWITFNSIWYPVGVILIFAFVQYLEANVIFPLAVSNRLNVNALATLIVIIAGGLLWGVAGMILFVPFLGIVKLVVDNHPKMKTWSMLLGTEVK